MVGGIEQHRGSASCRSCFDLPTEAKQQLWRELLKMLEFIDTRELGEMYHL